MDHSSLRDSYLIIISYLRGDPHIDDEFFTKSKSACLPCRPVIHTIGLDYNKNEKQDLSRFSLIPYLILFWLFQPITLNTLLYQIIHNFYLRIIRIILYTL